MPYPDTVRWAYNGYDNPNLVLAYDMSTRTAGGLMKNLAKTGATYDGTINGTYTPAPPLIRAKKTPCMDFDGVNNYISLANPLNGLTNMTVCAWINFDNNNIIYFSRATLGNLYLYIWTTGPKHRFGTPGGVTTTDTDNALPINNTYFVATVYSSNTYAKIYINGTQRGYNGNPGINPAEANAFIGQYFDGTLRWNGRLDNMLFYNIALTPEQVWAIYKSANPRM